MSNQTPATRAMAASGHPFELLHYDYDANAASIGLHAAQSLGLPPAQVFKTLMVMAGTEAVIAVLPSDHELSLKALAAAAGTKAAALMAKPDAERISGYKIGGVSPLGQRKRLRVFIDASAGTLDFIVVNGGQRGLQIKAAPAALIAATNAIVAALVA